MTANAGGPEASSVGHTVTAKRVDYILDVPTRQPDCFGTILVSTFYSDISRTICYKSKSSITKFHVCHARQME